MSTDRIIYVLFLMLQPVLLVFGYRRVQKTGVFHFWYPGFAPSTTDRKKDPRDFRNWVAIGFFLLWFGYVAQVLFFFFPPPWPVTAAQLQAAPTRP